MTNVWCRTKKIAYPTIDAARAALALTRTRSTPSSKTERRGPLCTYCLLWHLTSKKYKAKRGRGAKR